MSEGEMGKGGKRPKAGRPIKHDTKFRFALVNEVGILKAQHPLWTNQMILDDLERQGKLAGSARSGITRLLETRFNVQSTPDGEVDSREVLTTTNRDGILSVLPVLPIKK
jgi:hypothetical protein